MNQKKAFRYCVAFMQRKFFRWAQLNVQSTVWRNIVFSCFPSSLWSFLSLSLFSLPPFLLSFHVGSLFNHKLFCKDETLTLTESSFHSTELYLFSVQIFYMFRLYLITAFSNFSQLTSYSVTWDVVTLVYAVQAAMGQEMGILTTFSSNFRKNNIIDFGAKKLKFLITQNLTRWIFPWTGHSEFFAKLLQDFGTPRGLLNILFAVYFTHSRAFRCREDLGKSFFLCVGEKKKVVRKLVWWSFFCSLLFTEKDRLSYCSCNYYRRSAHG